MFYPASIPTGKQIWPQAWQPDAADVPQVPLAWAGTLVNGSSHLGPRTCGVMGSPEAGSPRDPEVAQSTQGATADVTANRSSPATTNGTNPKGYGMIPAQRIPYTSWDTGHGWWTTTLASYRSPDPLATHDPTGAREPETWGIVHRNGESEEANLLPPPPPPGAPQGNRLPPPPPRTKSLHNEAEHEPKSQGAIKHKQYQSAPVKEPPKRMTPVKQLPAGAHAGGWQGGMGVSPDGIPIKPPPPKKNQAPFKAPPPKNSNCPGAVALDRDTRQRRSRNIAARGQNPLRC